MGGLRPNQRRHATRALRNLRGARIGRGGGRTRLAAHRGANPRGGARAHPEARLVPPLEHLDRGGFDDAGDSRRLVVLPTLRRGARLVHADILRAFVSGRESRRRRHRQGRLQRSGRLGRLAGGRSGDRRLRRRRPARRIRARDWAGVRIPVSGRVHGVAGYHVEKPAERRIAGLPPHWRRRRGRPGARLDERRGRGRRRRLFALPVLGRADIRRAWRASRGVWRRA